MKIIERAITLLLEGELVAIPTETVYGLGADAKNPAAVQKVFTVKGRPTTNPLIIHLPNWDAMTDWAIDIPDSAYQLAKAFWPGPLTLILKRHPSVPKIVTGGQDTVALRVPNHPLTLELLERFKGGIAAPSANRYGRISPTTAEHVREELGDAVSYILDGGPCQIGIESTIVYLAGDNPFILRQGSILKRQILNVTQSNFDTNNLYKPIRDSLSEEISTFAAIITPGSSTSHYAPVHPLFLLKKEQLFKMLLQSIRTQKKAVVLSFTKKPEFLNFFNQTVGEKPDSYEKTKDIQWLNFSNDATSAAQQLYHQLRTLDKLKPDYILIEEPPDTEEWLAIRDRLFRAASPHSF